MFNNKLKKQIKNLEREVNSLECLLRIAMRCSKCGKQAEFKVFRRYVEKEDGALVFEDTFFCEECASKLE